MNNKAVILMLLSGKAAQVFAMWRLKYTILPPDLTLEQWAKILGESRN